MSTDAVETNGTQNSNPEQAYEATAPQPQGGLVQATQSSSLERYQPAPLPQNRPIEPSHTQVTHYLFGNRPVMSSGLDIDSSMVVSGNRPIMKSHLAISETYSVMGNRPVASNEIEDIQTLIGYLD